MTLVGNPGIVDQGVLAGLTFDGAGLLYAITSGGDLYQLNPTDGSGSLLWETGLQGVSGLSALWVPTDQRVPEPGSIAIWSLLCMVAVGWHWRGRRTA